VRDLAAAAPRLIPVFGHRYLLAEPCQTGNPVLSIYQTDVVVYGADLRCYLLAEFAGLLGIDHDTVQRDRYETIVEHAGIPFWGVAWDL
jgi:hypothetical protein